MSELEDCGPFDHERRRATEWRAPKQKTSAALHAAAAAHADQLFFVMALDLVDGRAVAPVAATGQELHDEDRSEEVSEPHRSP
ncbi:MAG TPA: hypothetical protein VGJ56_31015, partial [Reyranella sp.]